MSFNGPYGNLYEMSGQMQIEWEMKDFFSWSQNGEKVSSYYSPLYCFAGSCWYLKFSSNENEPGDRSKCFGFGIYRRNAGLSTGFVVRVGLKRKNGLIKEIMLTTFSYHGTDTGYGIPEFLKKSKLLEQEEVLVPEGTLILVCMLKHHSLEPSETTHFSRLQTLSFTALEMLKTRAHSDIVLRVEDGHFHANKAILSARSPVFAAMFQHDMQENRKGSVDIKDIECCVFKQLLAYIYSGEPQGISPESVCKLFQAADRYDLKELMKYCVEFMKENLSVETLFDVLSIADVHKDKSLEIEAKEYFVKHHDVIVRTELWKKFRNEDEERASEFVENAFSEVRDRWSIETRAVEERTAPYLRQYPF